MSIYGEGLYQDCERATGSRRKPVAAADQSAGLGIARRKRRAADPDPHARDKTPSLNSIYALYKYDQEQMCLMIGRAYGIPTVALRFFNIFGPNQALSNPYTGVLAIFASRLLNNRPPLINEDGLQKRDFVSVYDVARACRLALEAEGSGRADIQRRERQSVHHSRTRRSVLRRCSARTSSLKSPASTGPAIFAIALPISPRRESSSDTNRRSDSKKACRIWPAGWKGKSRTIA